MHFLYAVKSQNLITGKKLAALGLDKIIAAGFQQRQHSTGPEGVSCMVLSAGSAKETLYKPAEQVWEKSVTGKYFVGYWTASPPTAEELARASQIEGHIIETDSGRWKIPLARLVTGASGAIPQRIVIGKGGSIAYEPMAKYADFSKRAEDLWHDYLVSLKVLEEDDLLTEKQMVAFGVEALGFNYHVGTDEINALQIFNTLTFTDMIYAVIDRPTIVAYLDRQEGEKKKLTGDRIGLPCG